MATLTWQNSAGSLGSYPAGSVISMQFVALSDDLSSVVTYKLLSGNFPTGTKTDPFSISITGFLTGTLDVVSQQETYTFTIRAFDQYGNIRDRTFSLTTLVAELPSFVQPSGKLFAIYDSTWLDYQVQYVNPVSTNIVTISKTSGTLPPGLYLTSDGKIKGYAEPPVTTSGSPTSTTYSFTLTLNSSLWNGSIQYTIEVLNQRLFKPPHNRTPAIYNTRPLAPISSTDPYYGFYLPSDNVIPTVTANDFFTFKILGHDFEGDTLQYNFSSLPEGLNGDSATGWITGTPVMYSEGINDYVFNVSVSKLSRPLVTTATEKFSLRVINDLVEDIVWTSPSDLGIVYNNTICEMSVSATSTKTLVYSLYSGTLPANLSIENSGAISGRVAFQPSDTILFSGDETEFTFTVQAYAEDYPKLRSFKTFTLTVKQYYNQPVETVYFKAAPSVFGRNVLSSLLNDSDLIPTADLYRPDDFYFGKAENISIVQAYGITASSLSDYLAAIQQNHYYRNIVLGSLKTAIARNENGDIIYEVVYSEIVDDLVNASGVSIPLEITWPTTINLNLGPWTVNNSDIHASYSFDNTYYASLSPGYINKLNPASLDNMRDVLISNMGQDSDPKLLPTWMTSQQLDGNTVGFIRCWVLCYTLPGKSETIKSNIENNWSYTLNDIDCTFDRYLVDKSSTYNWNTELLIPAWTEVPSELANTSNHEQHDLTVLFPRKTILPKDSNY